MLIIILKVSLLLAFIIIPLAGPSKKQKSKTLKIDKDVTHSNYAINKEGNLVELSDRELFNHEH